MKLSGAVSPEDLARAAWPVAVGKFVAANSVPKSLVRGNLIVEVHDAVWQKQLFYLRFQILGKLCDLLGSAVVQDVEFRIAAPRRPPLTARTIRESKPPDEADRIRDPLMRIVYKQARKKASA